MANLAPFPTFFGIPTTRYNAITPNRGVTDPYSGILACELTMPHQSYVRLVAGFGGSVAVESNTDYTIKFQIKKISGNDPELRVAGETSNYIDDVSITGLTSEWQTKEYNFNTGAQTTLDDSTVIRNYTGAESVVHVTNVRIYKDVDGDPDPLGTLYGSGGTVYDLNDFSAYTSDLFPSSDWTERFEQQGAYTVRDGATYEGGKYLEHSKVSSGRNGISYDGVIADANRNNGIIRTKVLVPTGQDFVSSRIMLRGSGITSELNATFIAINNNEIFNAWYENGSYNNASSSYTQINNAQPALVDTLYNLEVSYYLDAILVKVWEDGTAYPEQYNYFAGTPILEGDYFGFFSFGADDHNFDTFHIGTGTATLDARPIKGNVDIDGVGSSAKVVIIQADDTNFTNASIFEIVDADASGNYETTGTMEDGKQYFGFAHKVDGADYYGSKAKTGQ